MKKENKSNFKFTLVTAGLALFSVCAAAVVIIMFFHFLKTTDGEYTQITDSQQTVPASDEESPQEPAENPAEIANIDETDSNSILTASDRERIEEEFTVDGHTFYRMNLGSSQELPENSLNAEEAAELALAAFQNYFPDESWDAPFTILLADNEHYMYSDDVISALWYIRNTKNTGVECPKLFLHPLTGQVTYISCYHTDPVYNGATEEGRQTPFLTIDDFVYLSRDSIWISTGVKIIRNLNLNEGESVISFNQEVGISFNQYGVVYIPFTIGGKENLKEMILYMDLYTKDFVGYHIRKQ